MYQRILVIQKRIDSSQWGYLQRKLFHHSKSIATRNANKNTCEPPWSRNFFTQARDVIYWPAMNSKVKYFISNCTACNDYLQNKSKELLISHPIPIKAWSRIVMDIMNVFKRNYLITVDFFSDF